jgi:hypothetical protein
MRYSLKIFWPKSNPFMPLVNFLKKFRLVSFDFRQNFKVRTFTWWLSIRGTEFFLRDIPNFFFQNLHYGPIRWVPRRFFQISIFYSRNLHFDYEFLSHFRKLLYAHAEHTLKQFYRMLSIRRTDFIAQWAYEERIFAHAQPAGNCEQFYMYPCWAYVERILSHTEHMRNGFHRMLRIRGTDFITCWACSEMFKSRISLPIRIRFF